MVMLFLLTVLIQQPATMDQHGKRHDPQQFAPGITVIDFAASWCQPCWKALPHVNALADKGVPVLVVSVDEKKSGRDKLVKKLGLTVPVIWDEGHQWANHFQPQGMPSTLIVSQEGTVLYRHVGFSQQSWQAFLGTLDRLKAQQKASLGDH